MDTKHFKALVMAGMLSLSSVTATTAIVGNIQPLNIYAADPVKDYLDVDKIGEIPVYKSILPYSPQHRPMKSMNPQYITIHNTSNNDYGADAEMHSIYLHGATEEEFVSWHFTVDNHEIIQHLPLDEIGYHAGDGENGTGNLASIAIEICENVDGNYAQAEKNAAKLVAELLYEMNMDISQVVPHKHWSGKECPENMLYKTDGSMGWDGFISYIQSELDSLILQKATTDAREDTMELKIGEKDNLTVFTTDTTNNYSLEKSGYKLNINKLENETPFRAMMDTVNVGYNQAVLVDSSSYEIEDAAAEFKTLLDSKAEVAVSRAIFDTKEYKFKDTGLTYMTFTSDKGTTKFIVYNYISGKPVITTNAETFVKMGSAMNLLMNNKVDAEWAVENSDILSIKDGKIEGMKEGTTKIIGKIGGVTIERKVHVSK